MYRIAGFCLILFLLQGAHGLLRSSGTVDELGAHLPAGILHWKCGRPAGGLANPPLGQAFVAAGGVLAGRADHPLAADPEALRATRIPVLALGALTLLAVAALGRRLGGPAVGAGAAAAAALSPNLIAHSGLATLDLPVTALGTFAALAAWSWARNGRVGSLVAWALAIGAAAMVKHSALHLLAAISVGSLLAGGRAEVRLRRASALALAGALGTLLIGWLVYGPGPSAGPFPAAWVAGISDKWAHGRAGHFAYLLGQRSSTGFPHYFLIAALVKTPLPLLIAAAVGSYRLARESVAGDSRGFAAFVLVPAVWIFLAMSLVHRVDIGLRHVLPAWPALLVLAGAGAAGLATAGRAGRLALGILGAWALAGAASTTPRHLSYFNELAGGPRGGDRFLIDSNLDWGQDESEFRAWAAEREVSVNPDHPVRGLVAANVNALHGILSPTDARLRWLRAFPVVHRVGATWRIFRVEGPELLPEGGSPVDALDRARWLLADGRAGDVEALLRRNNLSTHERLGREWWGLLAEARLASDHLAGAVEAAPRSGDRDLAAETAYRHSEARGTPWAARDERERSAVFGALIRRGHPEEAWALADRVLLETGETFPEALRLAVDDTAPSAERLARAATLKQLDRESEALAAVGALLAEDPTNESALWLYGELVVRRKLGLTEYAWPDVDWSGINRSGTPAP